MCSGAEAGSRPGAKGSLGPRTGPKGGFGPRASERTAATHLPRTPQGQVALGARDGGPGAAEGQQQGSLGGLGESRVKAAGGGRSIGADGRVPEDDRGPNAAPGLHAAPHIGVCLHGCVCPPPARPTAAWLLRPQADVHAVRGQGALGGAVGGAGGVRGDAGAALRGLGQLLQHPVTHCGQGEGRDVSGVWPGCFRALPGLQTIPGLKGLGSIQQQPRLEAQDLGTRLLSILPAG